MKIQIKTTLSLRVGDTVVCNGWPYKIVKVTDSSIGFIRGDYIASVVKVDSYGSKAVTEGAAKLMNILYPNGQWSMEGREIVSFREYEGLIQLMNGNKLYRIVTFDVCGQLHALLINIVSFEPWAKAVPIACSKSIISKELDALLYGYNGANFGAWTVYVDGKEVAKI